MRLAQIMKKIPTHSDYCNNTLPFSRLKKHFLYIVILLFRAKKIRVARSDVVNVFITFVILKVTA